MIKTFSKAREDINMISYIIDLSPYRRYNRMLLNRIRMDMNNKVDDLLNCIR